MTEQTTDQDVKHPELEPLIRSVTQREKFLLAARLERPYSELMEDPDRVMIALAWVKLKRENAGVAPNWDDLMDMTDEQILAVLGLGDDDDQDGSDPKDG